MDNKNMIKIGFAIFAVAALVFELFAYSGFGTTPDTQNIVVNTTSLHGATNFQVILLGYEPYLVVEKLNDSQIQMIRKNAKVEDITNNEQGSYVIVKSRTDVGTVSSYLESIGINNIAIANLQFPNQIIINTEDGRAIQASVANGAVVNYPLTTANIPVKTSLKAKMIAIVENSVLVGYEPNSFSLVSDIIMQNATATIKDTVGIVYTFTIPFENRNEIDEAKLKEELKTEDVRYVRSDYVDFGIPLTINETSDKKNLNYVTYINSGSISVNKNFTNASMIESDFINHSINFPTSILYIRTNETVGLNYNKTLDYNYMIELPEKIGEYTNYEKVVSAISKREYAQNNTINVSIKGSVIGTVITEIINAYIQ